MAVYTKISKEEVVAFLKTYDVGTFEALHGIKQGVENTNYRLITSQAQYILTLYEKRTHRDDLPFFLGLMEHVAKKGIPAPLPIRDHEGALLGELAGRPAALISFLSGQMSPRIKTEECFELGKGLASFHKAASDFPLHRSNSLSLKGWQTILDECLSRADEVEPGLAHKLEKEMNYLNTHWPKGLPFGIIHADMFCDNVFFNGPKLCGIIDFYFACEDFLAYDLAICLNAWCFENNKSFNITKAAALIRGYNQVKPLTEEELVALPLLARGSALRFHLTRLYDWLNQVPGALVRPKNPMEYWVRLKFHQGIQDVSAYGLAA